MRGLTQASLGAQIGVTRSQVTLWESGGRNPSPTSMKSLSQALEVNLEWLVTGNGSSALPRQGPEGVDLVLHQMVVDAVVSVFQKRGLNIRSQLFSKVVVTVYAATTILWANSSMKDANQFREHIEGAAEFMLGA